VGIDAKGFDSTTILSLVRKQHENWAKTGAIDESFKERLLWSIRLALKALFRRLRTIAKQRTKNSQWRAGATFQWNTRDRKYDFDAWRVGGAAASSLEEVVQRWDRRLTPITAFTIPKGVWTRTSQ